MSAGSLGTVWKGLVNIKVKIRGYVWTGMVGDSDCGWLRDRIVGVGSRSGGQYSGG